VYGRIIVFFFFARIKIGARCVLLRGALARVQTKAQNVSLRGTAKENKNQIYVFQYAPKKKNGGHAHRNCFFFF